MLKRYSLLVIVNMRVESGSSKKSKRSTTLLLLFNYCPTATMQQGLQAQHVALSQHQRVLNSLKLVLPKHIKHIKIGQATLKLYPGIKLLSQRQWIPIQLTTHHLLKTCKIFRLEVYRVAQKVSHYQESSLNRIKPHN